MASLGGQFREGISRMPTMEKCGRQQNCFHLAVYTSQKREWSTPKRFVNSTPFF